MAKQKIRPNIDVATLPQAQSVRIFFCGGAECRRPHVVLFDMVGEPIAQFVAPGIRDEDGGCFAADLVKATIQAATGWHLTDIEDGPIGHG